MEHRITLAGLAALAVLASACGAPGARPALVPPASYTPTAPLPGAVHVAFAIPRSDEAPRFFAQPWPSELLRRANGRPDFRRFPGRDALLFSNYVATAEEDVDGYSVSPSIYFHFSGPVVAPRFAADARASALPSSSVFLVDVDPESPERGTFVPVEHRHYTSALRFVPADTLAVKPLPGFVLRAGTLHAAVVRRELGGPAAMLGTPMDLEILKWTEPRPDAREERARSLHKAAFDTLDGLGVGRDRVAAIALFRTQIPHAVTARVLDVVTHLAGDRAPRVIEAAWADDRSIQAGPAPYFTIEGAYCTPNFQSDIGGAPFLSGQGGKLTFDASGAPRVVDLPEDSPYRAAECGASMKARFVLTFPAGPMPPSGFPLMVSAHGTGGDARSFLGERNFAGWAASQGIAVVSTDQPLHGGRGTSPRPGSREPIAISIAGIPLTLGRAGQASEMAFYNPVNPAAARDNLRQAAADSMVLARLVSGVDFAPLVPARPGRAAPRFDRDRLLLAGHSQGSQSMAAHAAVDPSVRGVILSGCGGDARLGILRRNDLPVMSVIGLLLGVAADELDEFHPLMTLLQTLADPIDPASYARLYWQPLPGRRPQSVLHFEGMTDTYTPPITAETLAIALRATPLTPVVKPLSWLSSPESALGDLLLRAGPTRAFAQFRATQQENGHFVIYHEPGAADLARQFMRAVIHPRESPPSPSPPPSPGGRGGPGG